jgi:hypothetical protein
MGYHQRKARHGPVDKTGGAVNDGPNGRVAGTDDLVVRHQRPDPMGLVDDFRSADTRKKILVATGKTDDFMRENRTADDDLVVVENQLVQPDGKFPAPELRRESRNSQGLPNGD